VKVSDLETSLGFACLQNRYEDGEITGGYTSDLLSDVMANAPDGGILITIQAHRNTIAVASLAGLRAVLLCNSREPDEEMLSAARDEGVAVFQTGQNQFQASCLVGAAL
jgi:hypothetical protein